ncbi:TadE family protein [Rhodoblastus sp.]|uniref:TadE/TadG family type IV pilus assembly protein n=1 Tax=Rhodoblastus sp. TaxID=1962975 RepID=UPI002612BA96|nr:TadE family protein [Rhodoblastus sp.]
MTLRKWRRSETGGATLEFALVSVPLLLVMFGVAEFGRSIWIQQALQNTSFKVARCAGLALASCAASGAYSASATLSYAETMAKQWGVTLGSSNVTLSHASSCPGQSGLTTFSMVTLTYPFSTVVAKLIPQLDGKTISASACFPNAS